MTWPARSALPTRSKATRCPVATSTSSSRRLASRTGTTCSGWEGRSEEHTSELQSLMRISYAVFCLKKKTKAYKQYATSKHLQTSLHTINPTHEIHTTTYTDE